MTALQQALKEFNMATEAWRPYFRLEQLTADERRVVDARALEIEHELATTSA